MALTKTERILLAILKVLLKNTRSEDPEIAAIRVVVGEIEVL